MLMLEMRKQKREWARVHHLCLPALLPPYPLLGNALPSLNGCLLGLEFGFSSFSFIELFDSITSV